VRLSIADKISEDVSFSAGEDLPPGLGKVTPRQEQILHEACHVITLGGGDETDQVYDGIADRINLLDGAGQRDNELRTLAVELVVLRQLGLLHHRGRFLRGLLASQEFIRRKNPSWWGLSTPEHHIRLDVALGRIRTLEVLPKTQEQARLALGKVREWARKWPL